MLDLKFIRENVDVVKQAVKNRDIKCDIDKILSLDKDRRMLINEVEGMKNTRNVSSRIAVIDQIHSKQGPSNREALRVLSQRIREMDDKLEKINEELSKLLYYVPNIPHSSTPVGLDATGNKTVRECGKRREFKFKPQAHWDIAENLRLLDFERAGKIAGSGFPLYIGMGARLERAMINFMLDLHTKK